MRVVPLVATATLAGGCVAGKVDLSPDDFSGYTVQFRPYVANGGVEVWWYDFDVRPLQPDGEGVEIDGMRGCNGEAHYDATGWSIGEYSDRIHVDFGAEWEEYILTDLNDFEDPKNGEFEYLASLGAVEMEGIFEVGLPATCVVGTTVVTSFCDCLHRCPDCATPTFQPLIPREE